jgi:hypothetical protein
VNVRLLGDEGELLKSPTVSQEISQRCQDWQRQAKAKEKPVATTYKFRGAYLLMYPNGASAWNYVLRNDCLEIKLEPRLHLAMVAKITFQSAYLWSVSAPHLAVDEVKNFLITQLFGDHLFLQIAQLDLCVDVMNFVPPKDVQRAFLSRPRKKRTIELSEKHQEIMNGRKLETVLFSGHGRPFSGKLYDKRAEIEQHSKKKWFYPRWKQNGWDEEAEVWRMEFSIEREGFHEVKIEGTYQALENIKRLWAYCSQEWLRMVIPGRDKKRTRWATHPTWTLIQQAFDTYSDVEREGLGPLVRARTREINIEQGIAAIAGNMTTVMAWSPHEMNPDHCVDEMFTFIREQVVARWQKTQVSPVELIREKKLLYSQVSEG